MTIDYDAVKAGIVSWISTVAGAYLRTREDGDPSIFWNEDAHNYQLEPYAALTLSDGGAQGVDATTWERLDDGTLSPRVRGNRQLLVEIEIRSRGDVNAPRDAAEALRASLYNEIILQDLQDDALAFVALDSFVTGAGFVHEGRRESIATLRVRFATVSESYDETINVAEVRNAGISNQMLDNAGNLVGDDVEALVGLDYPPD